MVRAETLFLVEDNGYIIGAINLRYAMTDDLLKLGGHMSFGIRPEERQKGYAFIMVKLALNRLRTSGITRALVTITRDNKAAQKTIRKIGGKLENAYESNGTVIDRYWISL
ncbi:GNAT family N-acetyltransferase [Proteiniclasticum aestuarii]